jgi:DNA-binding transcriptional regulator LsrR (DeoR family)
VAAWRLRDAVVVPDDPTAEGLTGQLAKGAARWLARQLRPGVRIGLGLGRTVSKLPDTFTVEESVDCSFTEIEGAASNESTGFAGYNVTARMATIAGGRAEFVYAPTFVSESGLRDRLIEERSISEALERARRSDIVMQSVGTVSESALLHLHGVVSADDLTRLAAAGAAGDALGHYFDADGRHVPFRTDEVHIGLTLDDLTKVPLSALVAGGGEKRDAIRGALRGRYFNVLITDSETARELIDEVA